MTEKISKSHDLFFRNIWSDRSVVVDFLRNYLPAKVLAIANLDTLEIQKDTFVEKRLRDYLSDILYRVDLAGEPGFIYILFEHKSHPYYWIHLQILRYMLEIWQMLLEQEKAARQLPVVVPIVIYHGPERWTPTRRFKSVFASPVDKLTEYAPDFEYILFDLSRYSDKDIRGEVLLRAVLTLMKHIFDPDIHQKLPAIFKLFKDLSDTLSGLRSLELLLRYLFNEVPDLTAQKAEKMMDEYVSKEKKEVFMTVAEQLRREGFEKGQIVGEKRGEKKGEKKGEKRAFLKSIEQGLHLRFGPEGLKLMPRIRKIQKTERLQALQAALYTAGDLSEFQGAMENKSLTTDRIPPMRDQ